MTARIALRSIRAAHASSSDRGAIAPARALFYFVRSVSAQCPRDLAIRNVCIDPGAELLFHAGHDRSRNITAAATQHLMNAYNAKLRAYLAANRYMDTLAFHSISGRDLKNSAIADVPSDLRRRGEMEHVGVVSAALKTALAGALLLGAATLAASDDRKAVRHPTGHAETRGTRTIPASKNSSRSNELATRPTPSDVGGRPAYAPPNECWTDDGGFRWRPCTAGGGGGM